MKKSKLLNILQNEREVVDAWATNAVESLDVSCSSGCAACCNLLPMTSLGEAVGTIIQLGDMWPKYKSRVLADVEKLDEYKGDSVRWFKEGRGCAFLEGDHCSIYPYRPTTCRSHLVISDPERCSNSVEGGGVDAVNPIGIEQELAPYEKAMVDCLEQPFYRAPLPWTFMLADLFLNDSSQYERVFSERKEQIVKHFIQRAELLRESILIGLGMV